jgi:hypothetical protein
MIFGVRVFNRASKLILKRKALCEKRKSQTSSITGKLLNRYTDIQIYYKDSIVVYQRKSKKRSKLHKIVSCKLSENQSELLSFYARHYYIRQTLTQPSVSMLVRRIISNFLIQAEGGRATILANSSDY